MVQGDRVDYDVLHAVAPLARRGKVSCRHGYRLSCMRVLT